MLPGALYYALYSRGDGTFHWAIARAIDARTFNKMHAKNTAGPWIFERIIEKTSAQPNTICIMVEIGKYSRWLIVYDAVRQHVLTEDFVG